MKRSMSSQKFQVPGSWFQTKPLNFELETRNFELKYAT